MSPKEREKLERETLENLQSMMAEGHLKVEKTENGLTFEINSAIIKAQLTVFIVSNQP